MKDEPLVSVIIPAFNGEKTIGKSVFSVVRQRYRHLELIVVDDASKDSTAEIVRDVVSKCGFLGRFEFVRHEVNLGLSRTLNDGLTRARGDFVLILHQDCELVGDNWVEKALSLMKDEKVAIVTGYYGISDVEDDSFVKRAFGILRKQFHSRPQVSCEEATFSEGKCDLYRKELLTKIGGFPTGYRIAGEDLIVSYKLRSLNYSIIKCFDLPVIQRFSGAAESFHGNLRKEFLFGKVMGGVFSEFKLFLFKGVKNSKYSGSRSLHRASQPAFILALILFTLFSLFSYWFVYLVIGLLFTRWIYYIFRVFGELEFYNNPINHPLMESLIIALIGITTDFAYSFGFGYGLIAYCLGRTL